MPVLSTGLARLHEIPALDLLGGPTPIHGMPRLAERIRAAPDLLVKRDDVIPFGFGGNKVRKMAIVAARAAAEGADTLLTVGGVQSNHARVTAAVAARLGMRCVLVANGREPEHLSGNALLDALLGAEVHYVPSREERAPAMAALAEEIRGAGGRPYEVPLGASTPLGALGFVKAVGELVGQGIVPDVIIHSTSSGGTQAGLLAGCALHQLPTRVIGISADDPPGVIAVAVRAIIEGIGELLDIDGHALADAQPIESVDAYVGGGYGIPTPASQEASELLARTEGLFVDHAYTAKAAAGLIGLLRSGALDEASTVLFWHTGGQVGLFA
ncbi:MAG: pyridoxal-phosphate dependent enzyme [Acidobacteriota bacterium]